MASFVPFRDSKSQLPSAALRNGVTSPPASLCRGLRGLGQPELLLVLYPVGHSDQKGITAPLGSPYFDGDGP